MTTLTQRLLAGFGATMAAVTIGGAGMAMAHATPTPPPSPPVNSQQCDAPEPGDTPDQPGAPDTEDAHDGDQGAPEVPCG